MTTEAITVHSRWSSKRFGIEVRISRVTDRAVSYRTLDFTFSGSLSQELFLQNFELLDGAQQEAER